MQTHAISSRLRRSMSEIATVPPEAPITSYSSTYDGPSLSASAQDTAAREPSTENFTPKASFPPVGAESRRHPSHFLEDRA